MTNKTVWHPQKSVANDGSEEGGRGSFVSTDQDHDSPLQKTNRKRTIIPRRRTPTVDVSVLVSNACAGKKSNQSKEKRKARDTYNTIECREGEGPGILASSSVVYRIKPQVSCSSDNKLCGWRERELDIYRELSDKSMTFSSFDKSRLQSQAEGLRSNLQSRAKRRSAAPSSRGKRREAYVFEHFNDVHDYIEHYCLHHSYTTFTVPELRQQMLMEKAVKEGLLEDNVTLEANGSAQGSATADVRAYEEEDPYLYLRELISRLGVKALVQNGHKPTPSSINKKMKTDEDLVVYSNGANTLKEEEQGLTDERIPSGNNSHQNSPRTTKSIARCGGQSTSLELPQIAQTVHIPPPQQRRGQSTNSVISVSKYLQVMSSQQQQRELESCENGRKDEEEEMDATTSSQNCLPHLPSSGSSLISPSTENTVQGEQSNGYRNAVEFNTPNSAMMKRAAQEQLMMLESSQKEKLLTNKANSLGLTSRDWARSSKAKRMLGNRYCETKREEDEREVSHTRTEQDRKTATGRQTVMSRPQTRLSTAVVNQASTSSESRREKSRSESIRKRSRMEESRMKEPRRVTEGSRKEEQRMEESRRLESRMEGQRRVESRMEGLRREESRMDRSRPATNHLQRYDKQTTDEWEERWKQARQSGRDNQPGHTPRRQRREEDSKKLEELKDIYDSSRKTNRVVTSRCGRNREPSNSRPVTRPTTSSCEQKRSKHRYKDHSRPVTQMGRSRVRPLMRQTVDYAKLNLDESCCWNEITRNAGSHSKTEQVQSSDTMDFDLDNILLKAKHRNRDGVAMVTVSLRNRRQANRLTDERIVAGASPKEIAEHTARVNKKFDGILKVQKPLTSTN